MKRNFLIAAFALLLTGPIYALPSIAATAPKPVAKVQVISQFDSYHAMKGFITGVDPSGKIVKNDIAAYFKANYKAKVKKFKTANLPSYKSLKKMKKAEIIDYAVFSIGDPGDKIMALRLAFGIKEGTYNFQSDTRKMYIRLMTAGRAGDIGFVRPGTGGPESAIAQDLRDHFGLDIFIAKKY